MITKQINCIGFNELFTFAEEEFNISRNDAYSLFFFPGFVQSALTYQCVNEYSLDDILNNIDLTNTLVGDNESYEDIIHRMTKEDILKKHARLKGHFIIGKFMIKHNIKDVFIDSRNSLSRYQDL